MRVSSSRITDVAWSLLVGVVAAISLIPINVIVLAIWLVFAIARYRQLGERSVLVTQFGVLAAVLLAVALLPLKATDYYLSRTISLNARQMSLQQLDAYFASPEFRQRLPIRTSLSFADDEKDLVVTWPSQEVTLAEFIAAIESQTPLRHQFRHCGNGWTLLSGGDCCFGLAFFDPEPAGGNRTPRKQYETKSW